MHEVGLAGSILKISLEAVGDSGAEKITSVRVKIGKYSGVEPESLRFAFDALSRDTLAEKAELVVDVPATVLQCGSCSAEYQTEDFPFLCNVCNRYCSKILHGSEFEIISLEVE
ncbi:MAG: hydrogenase maturation nickel metallochaperone HypA [Candidatus Riflebacteria bacterium]|nr:hydrogenase maturation nickel metallochaperone HypA [Candidatus Riflebacteria bacterium]